MKLITFLVLSLLSSFSLGEEDCSLNALGLTESSPVSERLFYSGTCHYRNQDYELSAKYWTELSDLQDVEEKYQELQIDSLNNLGYLTFYGYGLEMNKELALTYWKRAILLGHYESEYHLCHAYADSDQPTFNHALGKKHCEKAFLIYKGMEQPDQDILSQIQNYRSRLRNHP